MRKIYYLDNASTTRVFPEIFELMKNNNAENFYNPSAQYKNAFKAKSVLESARSDIEKCLNSKGGKLTFVSSATEANNMVISGVHLRAGQTALISAGEHPSIFATAKNLEARGIVVKLIPINSDGVVEEEVLKSYLEPSVAFVSIIHVSNETGAVNNISKLVKVVKDYNPKIIFHSDGVQAFGKIDVNVSELGVDLYTISSHKIYAPRGIAGLWIKNNVVLQPLLFGGNQEDGLRSSTENVDSALAFAYAAKKVVSELKINSEIVKKRKNDLIDALKASEISDFVKIFSNESCSPYIISMSFDGVKGEVLMRFLDDEGVIVSTGSACSSKKAGNRILSQMQKTQSEIVGSVRISFSPYEEFDAEQVCDAIVRCVKKLRFMD